MLATRTLNVQEMRDRKIAGSYHIVESSDGFIGMQFICPCGCQRESWINLDSQAPRPRWTLSGTSDTPTLHPSVHNTGLPCKWHGWLRHGQWVAV